MSYLIKKLKSRKGIAIVLTFMVTSVLLISSGVFVSMAINQNLTADIYKRRTKAFYMAEAGLDHAVYWLRAQGQPPIGNRTNPWGGVQTIKEGNYSVTITDLGIVGGTGTLRRYKVTSTGTFGNKSRVLTNFLQVDNYARYLWFTDREIYGGTNVWFWSQDHLNGPTHTNGHYNIYGNPIFESEVRSVDDYIRFYNNGHNVNLQQTTNPPFDLPDFQQGVDFGVAPTTMPTQALSLRSAASSGGISLTGNTTLVLNSNGTMNVTNAARGWNNRNMALPGNGALFVNSGTLTMTGTLNGRLTAGASSNVIIPNNIVYADDPRINPNADDTLGIISERNVVIDDIAPNNLEIDGCMMSLSTSFMRENYAVGPPKGTLTVLGGIIQDERGPVGTFNGATGQKLSGYSKNYLYDQRLLGSPPPFMPTTGDYLTLSWEED